MNEKEEQIYIQGERAVWNSLLRECLKNLGYDSDEANSAKWVVEREAVVIQLRDVCETFGDNEWDESLYLADVVEKHLAKHLFSAGSQTELSDFACTCGKCEPLEGNEEFCANTHLPIPQRH